MRFVTRTHTGRVRSNNEDCLGVLEQRNIAVVADGIGGRKYGEVASKLVVDAAIEYLSELEIEHFENDAARHLANAIKYANDEIITVQRNEPEYADMGSTMVSFAVNGTQLNFAWVGDSRVYRVRPLKNEIKLLTKDHTLDRSKIDPELAPDLYKRAGSILTQMVGSIMLLKPDFGTCQIEPGDIVLACTDGLSDMVMDNLMLEYAIRMNDADQLADKLLDRALDCGGHDNISFVILA